MSLFSLLLYIIITRLPTAGKKHHTHVPAYTLCLSASVSVSAPGPIPYCLGPSRPGPPSLVSSVISLLRLLIRPDPSSSTQKGKPCTPTAVGLGP